MNIINKRRMYRINYNNLTENLNALKLDIYVISRRYFFNIKTIKIHIYFFMYNS